MEPLCVTDPEYEFYDQEIQSSDQFLPQTGIFRENRKLTPLDFEPKFEKKLNP
jgi:hypothetical protein